MGRPHGQGRTGAITPPVTDHRSAGHVDFALGDITGDHIDDLVSITAGGDLYAYPGSGSINPTTTFWSGTRIGPWVGHTNITL